MNRLNFNIAAILHIGIFIIIMFNIIPLIWNNNSSDDELDISLKDTNLDNVVEEQKAKEIIKLNETNETILPNERLKNRISNYYK